MRDGLFRRAIKRVALWRYRTDLWFTRRITRLRGQAPVYLLRGHCNGCGACCEAPTIVLPTWLFFFRSVRGITRLWHRQVNGFELTGLDRRHRMMIFRCTHFDPVTRQCDSYDSRPGLCRDYPMNLLDDVRPTFFAKCSYYALHRDADAIRAELASESIPSQSRERVERIFFVWEPPAGQDAWHPAPDALTDTEALPPGLAAIAQSLPQAPETEAQRRDDSDRSDPSGGSGTASPPLAGA